MNTKIAYVMVLLAIWPCGPHIGPYGPHIDSCGPHIGLDRLHIDHKLGLHHGPYRHHIGLQVP